MQPWNPGPHSNNLKPQQRVLALKGMGCIQRQTLGRMPHSCSVFPGSCATSHSCTTSCLQLRTQATQYLLQHGPPRYTQESSPAQPSGPSSVQSPHSPGCDHLLPTAGAQRLNLYSSMCTPLSPSPSLSFWFTSLIVIALMCCSWAQGKL